MMPTMVLAVSLLTISTTCGDREMGVEEKAKSDQKGCDLCTYTYIKASSLRQGKDR